VGETELQKEVRLTNHYDEFAKEMKQNIQIGNQVTLPLVKWIIVV
jgi:hypothetical protein